MIAIPKEIKKNIYDGFYNSIMRNKVREIMDKDPEISEEEVSNRINGCLTSIHAETIKHSTMYLLAEGFYDSDAELQPVNTF